VRNVVNCVPRVAYSATGQSLGVLLVPADLPRCSETCQHGSGEIDHLARHEALQELRGRSCADVGCIRQAPVTSTVSVKSSVMKTL
jgi:hypothetical protein